MQVVDILAEMGIKNLRIAASSLTSAHNGLVAHIENGVVNRLETSGIRGKLATAVSEGVLGENPAVIRSHGGRARAITSGDVKIDVAFLASSSADCMDDSTIAYRQDINTLRKVQLDAKKVLEVTKDDIDKFNKMTIDLEKEYIAKNISPGGSADLLAISIFMLDIKKNMWCFV